jgi:hypothetical protein
MRIGKKGQLAVHLWEDLKFRCEKVRDLDT